MSRTKHHGNKAKERLFGANWRWMEKEPKWWRQEFNHTPCRARERNKLSKLEFEDYPDWKKPHVYYW